MNKSVSVSSQTPISRPDSGELASPLWFFRFFAVYAVYTLVMLGVLYVDFFGHLWAPDTSWNSIAYRLFLGLVLVPAGIAISLLVLRRTHRNVTGLFLLINAVSVMTTSLRVDSPLQVLTNWTNAAGVGIWLLPLYFPDGTVYPQRFRKWIRLHSVFTAIFFAGAVFFNPTVEIQLGGGQVFQATNPLLVPLPHSLLAFGGTIQALFFFSTVLLMFPSVVLRFRASKGIVRQQIKVFVWAFAFLISVFIIFLPFFSSPPAAWQDNRYGFLTPFLVFFSAILFPAVPFAVVGYAILRHKLYDIDIIIRRTLQYGAITGLLALVYFGGVALFQSLFGVLTGEESPLAVVISTLAIAALFTPLRKRVQIFVDRRFYRQKYDAERTLERFSETMRDEVDLDRMTVELVAAVESTMQPEHVGLWIARQQADDLK